LIIWEGAEAGYKNFEAVQTSELQAASEIFESTIFDIVYHVTISYHILEETG